MKPRVYGDGMDLRAVQKPLKDAYRADADAARITLSARGSGAGVPISCSVDLGRAIYEAQAHSGQQPRIDLQVPAVESAAAPRHHAA